MIRKGFVIDLQKYIITREFEYDDKVYEDLYVKEIGVTSKEGRNLLTAAFVFPIEAKESVQKRLDELKAAKAAFDAVVSRIYYREFVLIRKGELS